MALYAIADLHLSLGTDKPMDVFRGWEKRRGAVGEKLARPRYRRGYRCHRRGYFPGACGWKRPESDFAFIEKSAGQKAVVKRQSRLLVVHAQQDRDIFAQKGLQNDAAVFNSAERGGHYGLQRAAGFYNAETAEDKNRRARNGRLIASLNAAKPSAAHPSCSCITRRRTIPHSAGNCWIRCRHTA